ncbi:terminase large subunit domain-containing protein [Sphingomonas sp. BK481]|uniref:terminase large subunit domain-containing protein n=1 Tax=Sphingomonas sp. BK481 TaxID=2586981 RepID=UPI00161353BC|nr:terminase family protein [Sphingomonas sp. BK481]MBB3588014.1 phage terminase large subunit-like protein [Sphingomonas sp. BK481]
MADSGGATFDPAVLARLRGLPRGQLVTLLRGLSEAELRTLHESWAIWALPGQREPAGDWQVWLIRAGRGFGKTRAGAEWVSALARAMPGARIAMVGGTMDDVRKVMVEGESGLIAVAQAGETYRWRRWRWSPAAVSRLRENRACGGSSRRGSRRW